MDFEAYKNKWELYDRFAKTVKSILDAAFQNSEPKYQLQQIQARAKSPESLYNRLKESNKLTSKKVEDLRKDLAGCRIIFYHNGDVKRSLNSDIIRDNFKIIDIKLHHHEAIIGGKNPRKNMQLIKAITKAFMWNEQLEKGERTSYQDIANHEGISSSSFVNRSMRLRFLAPDIIEAIFEGYQPADLTVSKLFAVKELDWKKQRKQLSFS